jgi:hypothetical protein
VFIGHGETKNAEVPEEFAFPDIVICVEESTVRIVVPAAMPVPKT